MLAAMQTLKHFVEECEPSLRSEREQESERGRKGESCNPLAMSAEVGAMAEMVRLVLILANPIIGLCSFASRTIELNVFYSNCFVFSFSFPNNFNVLSLLTR